MRLVSFLIFWYVWQWSLTFLPETVNDMDALYRKTEEFNALDIVLNFDIHRFHTFWYTSTIIMFHHFSLKLPTVALIFTYFWRKKIWEHITLNLNVITPKGTSVRETTCFKFQMFNISYICDLYTRWKTNCLIDWVLVRKKTETSPILPSQNGLTDFCQIISIRLD